MRALLKLSSDPDLLQLGNVDGQQPEEEPLRDLEVLAELKLGFRLCPISIPLANLSLVHLHLFQIHRIAQQETIQIVVKSDEAAELQEYAVEAQARRKLKAAS